MQSKQCEAAISANSHWSGTAHDVPVPQWAEHNDQHSYKRNLEHYSRDMLTLELWYIDISKNVDYTSLASLYSSSFTPRLLPWNASASSAKQQEDVSHYQGDGKAENNTYFFSHQ